MPFSPAPRRRRPLPVGLLPGFSRRDGPEGARRAGRADELLDRAIALFRKEAEAGDAEARYRPGALHLYGTGVEQNGSEAVGWYIRAGEQGHAESQYALGCLYFAGREVQRSRFEALRWFRMASIQGHGEATAAIAKVRKDD